MLLAIDIGNTHITIGIFKEDKMIVTWRVATGMNRLVDEYGMLLLELLRHWKIAVGDVTSVAMCSVVPSFTPTFQELSRKYFNTDALLVEVGVKTGVRIRLDNPREAGADRIVNAAAAHHLYEGPVIIADLGTATTFDTVSREGDYLGGAIAPGMNTAVEALSSRASMLPRIELVRPARAIGTNTLDAMRSGMVFGYVGLVEGIIGRIQQELDERATVVATGGFADLIAKESPVIDVVNPDLTLIGLRLIYIMNRP